MTKYTNVMSGVQILFIINTKQPAVKLGTAKIYFLKKKRILNTALVVEDLLIYKQIAFHRYHIHFKDL